MSVNLEAVTFKAVAACAAVDRDGVVQAYTLEDFSIDKWKFVRFVEMLRSNIGSGQTIFLVVDQLRVHYTHVVVECCRANDVFLVYNASYSSEFMPCEIVWAIAKKKFRKLLIEKERGKLTQAQVKALIATSIEGAS